MITSTKKELDELIEKYNDLVEKYNKVNEEYIELKNIILNIDFQCYISKLKTPTIKRIREIIKEYNEE
jgi:hypothetical protein